MRTYLFRNKDSLAEFQSLTHKPARIFVCSKFTTECSTAFSEESIDVVVHSTLVEARFDTNCFDPEMAELVMLKLSQQTSLKTLKIADQNLALSLRLRLFRNTSFRSLKKLFVLGIDFPKDQFQQFVKSLRYCKTLELLQLKQPRQMTQVNELNLITLAFAKLPLQTIWLNDCSLGAVAVYCLASQMAPSKGIDSVSDLSLSIEAQGDINSQRILNRSCSYLLAALEKSNSLSRLSLWDFYSSGLKKDTAKIFLEKLEKDEVKLGQMAWL